MHTTTDRCERPSARHPTGYMGEEAEKRVEILRLRFTPGLPIREIARLWNEDARTVHRQYEVARQEYREAPAGGNRVP